MKSVIINTLADIYTIKKHLLTYLPLLANKAQTKRLRVTILATSINLAAQLMRLDMAFAILAGKRDINQTKEGNLKLDDYIKNNLESVESFKTDVELLTHLIMIEGLEISSFSLVKSMMNSVKGNTVHDLIDQNLKDSITSRANLELVLHEYLVM